jgi:hypothetical protein
MPTFIEAAFGKRRRTGERRNTGRRKYWIQSAIKKPGVLRKEVQRRYGRVGFTSKGTIKSEVLSEMARNGVWGRRARLAITLRGLKKR